MAEQLGLWGIVACGVMTAVWPRLRVQWATAAFVVAFGCLVRLAWAFGSEDWSFLVVSDNTRAGVAWPMRVAGLWAGPEGSLLLWTVMVAGVTALAVRSASSDPLSSGLVAGLLGGGLTAAYAGAVALVASPFQRPDLPPVGGIGLQPILEHPAMTWHPPVLYAGLVGLLYPSIRSAAARSLTERRLWLPPLGLLVIGLATGSRWAHAEVGWGGYWAWDPIETAGLVAFLVGAAAVHAGFPDGRPSGRINVVLGVLPAMAALWATTITRIGVVESVHAFADNPTLRVALIAIAATASLAFGLAATAAPPGTSLVGRTPSLFATGCSSTAPSDVRCTRLRDEAAGWGSAGLSSARLGAGVLGLAGLVVAVGTYEPLVEAATTGDRLAVGGHYFTRVLWPVVVVGGCVAAVAFASRRRMILTLAGAGAGAGVAVAFTPLAAGPFGLVLAGVGGAVVGSASIVGRVTSGGRPAGRMAHLGVGLLLVGIAGTLATERATVRLDVGEHRSTIGLDLVHVGLEVPTEPVDSAGRRVATASLQVDGSLLAPSLVSYPLRGTSTAEVAHGFRGLDEVQVILIDGDARTTTYRVHRIPRVGLVWMGAALLAAGLLVRSTSRQRPSQDSGTDRPDG